MDVATCVPGLNSEPSCSLTLVWWQRSAALRSFASQTGKRRETLNHLALICRYNTRTFGAQHLKRRWRPYWILRELYFFYNWNVRTLAGWASTLFFPRQSEVVLSLKLLKLYAVTLKTTLVLVVKILATFHFPFPFGGCKTPGLSAIASADTSEP